MAASGEVVKPKAPADRAGRLSRLRERLARGLGKIKAIRARNERRRRAIARLVHEQDSGRLFHMYDDVDLDLIPTDAPAVAGYVDGLYRTFPLLRARFPKAWRIPIAVFATDKASFLDVENGDATANQVVPWIRARLAEGRHRPGFYTSVSSVQGIVNLLEAAGIKRDEYRIWSAHYTFAPHICSPHSCAYPGLEVDADATQYTDRALGRSLDETLTHRDFFS
jgi:hypothetical protein